MSRFPGAMAYLGARLILPVFFGFALFVLLHRAYGLDAHPAEGAALTFLLVLSLDAAWVQGTFQSSRDLTGMTPTWGEAQTLLTRLFGKYALVILGGLVGFEGAKRRGLADGGCLPVALALAVVVYGLFTRLHNESVHHKGTEVVTFATARWRALLSGSPLGEWFRFTPKLWLSASALRFGVILFGGSRTGKTLLLRTMLQVLLSGRAYSFWGVRRSTANTRPVRAFVLDAKADLLAVVLGMSPPCPIYVLNPFDDPKKSIPGKVYRAVRWNIARDCQTPPHAKTIAQVFVPDDPKVQADPFWVKATIRIVSGVLIALTHHRGEDWTLADVVRAFDDDTGKDLEDLLMGCPYTRNRLFYLRKAQNSAGDILKTICNYIGELEEIAALWLRSDQEIALSDWARGEGILLATMDHTAKAPLDALYRAFFKRMVQVLLAPGAEKHGRTIVCLDELTQVGQMPLLPDLVTMGYGKNTMVLMATQSREGLAAAMGRERVSEIIGQARLRLFCKLDEKDTNRALSEELGKRWYWATTPAHGTSPERRELREEYAVSPEDLMRLQPADFQDGLEAVVTGPFLRGVTKLQLTGRELRGALLPPADIEATEPITKKDDYFVPPWTPEEREALGLPPTRSTDSAEEGPFKTEGEKVLGPNILDIRDAKKGAAQRPKRKRSPR